MKLSDILGQERAVSVLRESVERGRLHHALLFTGPDGVGKLSTAFALASWLLCEKRSNDACGLCGACAQVSAEAAPGPRDAARKHAPTHPDVYFEELRQNERGGMRKLVSIDQVRDIQIALGRSALGGGWKIGIVDDAHLLSPDAQNSFLKTLEEPPPQTLLVLVARNASALTPTIRSRCQHLSFAALAPEVVERVLAANGKSPDEARWLAARAEGSPGFALGLDVAAFRAAEERLREILDDADGRDYRSVVSAAQVLVAEKGPLGLPLLIRMLRLRLRTAAGVGEADESARARSTVTLHAVLKAAEEAYRTSVDLRSNANPSIALEHMWLEIGQALARPRSP